MSREADAKNLRLYDRRTIERNIKKGLITRKDYEKFLKSLDDATAKGVMGEEEPDDFDDDLDDDDTTDEVAASGSDDEPPPSAMNSH